MKSALSIALVICLVWSTAAVSAQQQMWSRVLELEPGTEIEVIVKGSPPAKRLFIAADASAVTLLNAAEPGISGAVRQIVLQIGRENIAEISVRDRHVGKATGWGAVVGGAAGFVAGLVAGTRACRTRSCTDFPPIAYGLMFSTLGGGIGSGFGAIVGAAKGKTQEVVYRAP